MIDAFHSVAPRAADRAPGRIHAVRYALIACLAVVSALSGCAGESTTRLRDGGPVTSAPISVFPLGHYDQNVDRWIDPRSPNYDVPFLAADVQRAQFAALSDRYFGAAPDDPSPWNPAYIGRQVYANGGKDIVALQEQRFARFDNSDKPGRLVGYGMNFRAHTRAWIDAIARNVDAGQFTRANSYDASRRAIATTTLPVRELPTLDPSFYDYRIAGEGYPFDNLQVSAVRPGTPLYMLGTSADGSWSYVQTPDVQGWVRSDGVASVDDAFVHTWRVASRGRLGVVVAASVPVRDDRGVYRFDAPAGTLLPLQPASTAGNAGMLVPARNPDGQAVIRTATLDASDVAIAPLTATPRHLATLLKALIGRPYGWGNTNFDNDCSSELQSIFAAFGVWLPRHSSTQMSAGHMIDLSQSTPAERLDYLSRHGEAMHTLVYIGGHVMLYLGNASVDGHVVPIVYQDIWGLRPADDSLRAVVGGSVILPLLPRYPEDPDLESLAATPTFEISILGMPVTGAPEPEQGENPAG
ncbi:SH3 domain-containing C40 family peptidase [Paraburkholderia phosphatilytica]|uniref:SH3 domain-containing C40 family peptidase n=1 Tax=Paraburkholderia phosphatilytica TaxID=2282883 RepID=UPI000E5471A5|nr:SH3 domain-containing C40 family peptidase [Paraburkholderia phosphatilytica]